jgi:hypothetical protein
MDAKTWALLEKNPEFKAKFKDLKLLMHQITKPFFTIDEASVYLKMSESDLKKLCKQNLIPHSNPTPRKFYFNKEAIYKWEKSKSKTKTKK